MRNNSNSKPLTLIEKYKQFVIHYTDDNVMYNNINNSQLYTDLIIKYIEYINIQKDHSSMSLNIVKEYILSVLRDYLHISPGIIKIFKEIRIDNFFDQMKIEYTNIILNI